MVVQKKRPTGFYSKTEHKAPILFGVIGQVVPENLRVNSRSREIPIFGKHEIVGTLDLKKTNLSNVMPLPVEYLRRIENNLQKMYTDGKFSNSRTIIDFKEGELLVSFPYNQAAVERIKGLDKNERAWEPESKVWRIFIGCFDDVLDVLGKGFLISDEAYKALCEFIKTPYYAALGRGKLAKLILRESWFEELDIKNMPQISVLYKSSLHLAGEKSAGPFDLSIERVDDLVNNFAYARKPFAHQKTGVEFLLANPDAALLDEMGCGKSFQIATAISILFQEKLVNGAIIVAPMSLLRTWQEELLLANIPNFQVISGTAKQREKALASGAKVLIIHYEGLRLEAERLSLWLKERKGILVFDESQRIKNLKAQTTQAAIQLRPIAARCVIATGTPIANRPLDLFSQYLVMDKGKTFGNKFGIFKNTFCEIEIQKISVGKRKIPIERFLGIKNGFELNNRIRRTSLRRLKSEVLDLPPIVTKDYLIEMKGEQKNCYQQMRDNLRVEIAGMSSAQIKENAAMLVVKILRLSQIASNPRLLFPEFDGANCKIDELDGLLEDIFADDTKKVIVWSHYVENINYMVEKYQQAYGAVGHTGEMEVSERGKSVKAFQDDIATRLFIATPQSAKEGLTLLPRDGKTVADTMIYLDFSFDSASYIQSQARFHRIGQEALRCLVIHLVADGSIDEYIRKNILEKLKTAKLVIDGINDDKIINGLASQPFSKEDFLGML